MRGLACLVTTGLALLVVSLPAPEILAEDRPVADQSATVPGVSDEELDAERGGEIVPMSESALTATLEENTLTGSVTGANTVAGSAFTGASGVFTVIQNSGNQVIIQDSTIINLTVE